MMIDAQRKGVEWTLHTIVWPTVTAGFFAGLSMGWMCESIMKALNMFNATKDASVKPITSLDTIILINCTLVFSMNCLLSMSFMAWRYRITLHIIELTHKAERRCYLVCSCLWHKCIPHWHSSNIGSYLCCIMLLGTIPFTTKTSKLCKYT